MSKHFFHHSLLLVLLLASLCSSAQSNGDKEQHPDTVKIYNCSYSIHQIDDTTEYKINGKPVNEIEFKKYTNPYFEKKKCTPCVLIEMDLDGRKVAEGVFYNDCAGEDKKIELRDKTEDSEHIIIKSNSCKDGEWIYYTEEGTVKEVKYFYHGTELKDKNNTLH